MTHQLVANNPPLDLSGTSPRELRVETGTHLSPVRLLIKTFLVMFLGEERFFRPFDESPDGREMKR